MEKRTKDMPAVKSVALLALFVLLALGAFFALGMVEKPMVDLGEIGFVAEKETYGITWVIDEFKLIFEDVGAYFKGIWESVDMKLDAVENGKGIALLCSTALQKIYPIVTLLCFVMVALRVAFCWTPFVRLRAIGWSRVALRLGKKLRKTVAWVIGYIVYTFAVHNGVVAMEMLIWGKIAVYMIALYAVVRVLLDGIGKKKVLNTVFTTISTALIALFAVIVFDRFLFDTALWAAIFSCVESAVVLMQSDEKNSEMTMYCIFLALSWLCTFVAVQRVAKVFEKQVTVDRGGVRKSLIFLLIWIAAAAALNFFGTKKVMTDLDLNTWKALTDGEYFYKSVIYGAIGLGLVIITPIMNCIGRKKDVEEE